VIDTQAIRTKILDLAMRGKLTAQLPEDGSAEELYQQIQKEKQAHIKTGKLKKEKSLAEIADDELPFEIPNNWKWVKLGRIASILGGKRIPVGRSLTQNDTGHKYIRVSDMKNCSVQTEGLLFVPEEIFPSISQYVINKEDVYITVAGTIGRVGKIPPEIDGANLTENADRIVFSHLDQDWLIMCLSASVIQNQIEILTTSVAQPKLAIQRIQEFQVPLPPLAEQHRIVARIEQAFSALDTIDTLQSQYADNLTVLKAKLLDAAIQGKLTDQLPEDGTAEDLSRQIQSQKQTLIQAGKLKKEKPLAIITADEIPFEIPANWKWVRIGSIGITVTGGTPSKAHPAYYGGSYPFFKPSDLDAGRHITKASEYLTEAGKNVARQLQQGSILVCCIGSIGKAAIIDTDGTANQQITALTPLESDSDYLLYAIASGAFQHQLEQGSRATTVSIINKSKFDNCILPLPPLAEQKRIASKLEELLPLCESLQKAL